MLTGAGNLGLLSPENGEKEKTFAQYTCKQNIKNAFYLAGWKLCVSILSEASKGTDAVCFPASNKAITNPRAEKNQQQHPTTTGRRLNSDMLCLSSAAVRGRGG